MGIPYVSHQIMGCPSMGSRKLTHALILGSTPSFLAEDYLAWIDIGSVEESTNLQGVASRAAIIPVVWIYLEGNPGWLWYITGIPAPPASEWGL